MPEPSERIFRVLPRQVDQTVAAVLRQWLPGSSWSQVRNLLKARRIMIHGNLCVDEGRRLKLSDVVKLLDKPAPAPPKPSDVRVRYLDSHIVVVEKPAGMTTTRHKEERDWPARRKQLQPTLDELLPAIIARMESRQRGKGVPPPIRPVHRLDRETSGLLAFARSVKGERNLGEQFRHHTTKRRYLAVVLGGVGAQTIRSRLVRDRGDGRRGSTTDADVGKIAVTHVRPLERIGNYTLVECRLETGRTHQIRIHLSERGHPLCGEKVYRKPMHGKVIPDESGAPRVALHAAELGFKHPVTGEEMQFEMPLPDDLERFLKRLRGEAKAAGNP
ncbi:MAG: RluA family pseudouridine synthase [Candidatus Sulfotelmatobacter sp.]